MSTIFILLFCLLNVGSSLEINIKDDFRCLNLGNIEPGKDVIISPGIMLKVVSPEHGWQLFVESPDKFESDDRQAIPIERLSICDNSRNEFNCVNLSPGNLRFIPNQKPTSLAGQELSFSYKVRLSFSDRPSKTGYTALLKYKLLPTALDNTYAIPDPFSPDGDGVDETTDIFFFLQDSLRANISIFDIKRTTIRVLAKDITFYKGLNSVTWDGKDHKNQIVPDGDYEYRIELSNGDTIIGVVKVKCNKKTSSGFLRDDYPILLNNGENSFFISKSVLKGSYYRGDIISYKIKISSSRSEAITKFVLYDKPDQGISYLRSSTYVNGVKAQDPTITRDGLEWNEELAQPEKTIIIEYKAIVTLDCPLGVRTNIAYAELYTIGTKFVTPKVSSDILVLGGGIISSSVLWGTVYEDKNGNHIMDEGEKGVSDVFLLLENGEAVKTDGFGRFSFPYVRSGDHIVLLKGNSRNDKIFDPISKSISTKNGGIYYLSFPVQYSNTAKTSYKMNVGFVFSSTYENTRDKIENDLRFNITRKFSDECSISVSFDTSEVKPGGISDDHRGQLIGLGDDSELFRRQKSKLIFDFVKEKSYIRYGFRSLGFADRELSSWMVVQEGAEMFLQTKPADIEMFVARAKSVTVEERFELENGRNVFNLKNYPIIFGSDDVVLEIYDSASSTLLSSKRLERGSEYNIDYDNGRINIVSPVVFSMFPGRYHILSVSYRYEIKAFQLLTANYGISGKIFLGENLVIKSSYVMERGTNAKRELLGFGIGLHSGTTLDFSSEVASTIEKPVLSASKDGFGYALRLGLNLSKYIYLYSYSNFINKWFWNQTRLNNPVPQEIMLWRYSSFFSPIAKKDYGSTGLGIILNRDGKISLFIVSRLINRETLSSGSKNEINWGSGVNFKSKVFGLFSASYIEELSQSEAENSGRIRGIYVGHRRNGKAESNVFYSLRWLNSTGTKFETESSGDLKFMVQKAFVPSFYWYSYESYRKAYEDLVSASHFFMLGASSSLSEILSFSIFTGLEAKNTAQGKSLNYGLIRFQGSVDDGEKFSGSATGEVKKGRLFIGRNVSMKFDSHITSSVSFEGEYIIDQMKKNSNLEYQKIVRNISFSLRPTSTEILNVFASYSGGGNIDVSETTPVQKRYESATLGATFCPINILKLGLTHQHHFEKNLNEWHSLFLTIANLTVHLPLKISSTTYIRVVAQSSKTKELCTTELSRTFFEALKLTFGYNLLYKSDITFDEFKKGKYYITLTALKTIVK